MSSGTSTEFTMSQDAIDNSKITINAGSSKLILENNSSDITISKYDATNSYKHLPSTSHSLTMKTQVLPLVYMPTCKTNNVIVINTNNTAVTSSNLQTNKQNVILATARPQSLLLQKQQTGVVPVVPVSVPGSTKITGAYLTMLKPLAKSNEVPQVSKIQVANSLVPPLTDFSLLKNNNAFIQSQNNTQKFVIAPMPNVTANRLPATATTNSVQPKIALLPMPVPTSDQVLATKYIYKSSLDSDASSGSIMKHESLGTENSMDSNSESLVCDEVIDLNSPEKDNLGNKTYELSITEDSVSSQCDLRSSNSMIISKSSAKEISKFVKHGVSILKKNYFFDRKMDRSLSHITSVNAPNSVSENKEVNGQKLNSAEDGIVITIPQKTDKEHRRKSNFSYRKEFDDVEVTAMDNSDPNMKPAEIAKSLTAEDPRKKLTSEIEIELIKDKLEAPKNEIDIHKLLVWDDGIGTLPGSSLKFIINEFNILEYITDDEYKTIIEKRMAKAKEKMKTEMQEEMRCLECGCYGLPSEFINPKFCSYDCQETNLSRNKKEVLPKIDKYKRNRRKNRPEFDPATTNVKLESKEEDISEEDSNDNSSQDKFLPCPWTCTKKGFSWSKYLDHIKAKSAPVKLFKDPFPYNRNGFRPGMKLEGVDPQHTSYFCVLSVAEVVGYRMRLHFDGYPGSYDFWCNADSMDIFPMGWCEKHSHTLQPPPGYKIDNFNWLQYLKQTRSTAAPKHLFANRAGQAICPNGFRVGMKLEAVDRKNTSLVCVASVRDMMDNRILVHFDSWDDIYDYWADPTSPYIHPVGWCDQYGHNLTPPNDYPSPETFSWEIYLKETKSVAAPVRAFKQRPACGFKRGMRLECVDKRVPQLIRVATVDDVREHHIRIHFDGWLDRYSYWVDDDSPDIHPVGWCQKTGHPIEPPLTPDDVYDFMECRTVGCKGIGHIKGPKYLTHNNQKYCPYAEENIDLEKILPDRLLSPDRSPEEVVPVSREPKECRLKPRVGRPPKYLKLREPKLEPSEEPPEKKLKRKYTKTVKAPASDSIEGKALNFIEESNVLPAERESWNKHSKFLQKYTRTNIDPRFWTYREVINFVSALPSCEGEGEIFKKERIDGEAFLLLTQKDILSILKFKVGPAVKLYNSIVLLRQQVYDRIFT